MSWKRDMKAQLVGWIVVGERKERKATHTRATHTRAVLLDNSIALTIKSLLGL